MKRTAAFVTLGCKINQYETEAIREEVLSRGYREVPFGEPADVYVVNTCAVTSTSATKSRKYVHRVARTHPGAEILVVGCSIPSERERMAAIPQVAVLAGNEEKTLIASYLDGSWRPGMPIPEDAKDIFKLRLSGAPGQSRGTGGRTRAYVKVQDGCNSFCSFCIIPFLRGRSRSRAPGEVVAEVERLVDNGYREVVLTGVHIQDYGEDLDPPVTLPRLLTQVSELPGLQRVRLSSMGVRAFTPEMLDVLEHPVFCRHWHIPLQAGADSVLQEMRRDYTAGEFLATIDTLKARFSSPAISSDVIVGHPGESEHDFGATLAVCRRVGFSKIHVFPYSPREGTLSAKIGKLVPGDEIRHRARELRELEAELARAYKDPYVGETVDVLVEGAGEAPAPPPSLSGGAAYSLASSTEPVGGGDGDGGATVAGGVGNAGGGEASRGGAERNAGGIEAELSGLTDRYLKVVFAVSSDRAAERLAGTLQPVQVTAATADVLRGEWAGELAEPRGLGQGASA